MRLGLLGPAGGDVVALGRAAEFLLNGARVHRAVYLGNDAALDRAVAAWARKLVGSDPSDEGAWSRALDVALTATPQRIDRFVANERARLRLKALEALPQGGARTVELGGGRVALLDFDATPIEQAERRAADIVLFGNGEGPRIEKVGARWFVTPAPIGTAGGGLAVLDDEHDDVYVTIFDSTGKPSRREALKAPRAVGES